MSASIVTRDQRDGCQAQQASPAHFVVFQSATNLLQDFRGIERLQQLTHTHTVRNLSWVTKRTRRLLTSCTSLIKGLNMPSMKWHIKLATRCRIIPSCSVSHWLITVVWRLSGVKWTVRKVQNFQDNHPSGNVKFCDMSQAAWHSYPSCGNTRVIFNSTINVHLRCY